MKTLLNTQSFFIMLLFSQCFLPQNIIAVEMEKDPTLEMKINAKIMNDGFHAEFIIPSHLVMNAEGPYSLTFENFKRDDGSQKADKSAFNFTNKTAFVKGSKMDPKKTTVVKIVLFICDAKKTWCRRVLREVSL